ncbi:MAG: TonB-dependent receptor, partial [Candidatus Krumholzibacteria bacterium]|nr:TonB-dependent receptor [Candidatus Krumholzibacteria bacterium]
LSGVNRIEIYRGFSPPHLGSSAIGGAINLVSFAEEDSGRTGPELTMSATAGSFGTGRYLLSFHSGATRVRFRGHASYMESRGDFSFVDDRSTPLNPLDDQTTTRLNNDFTLWNILGRVELDLPAFDGVSLSHDAVLREGGVPGLGSNQSLVARSERATHITYLKLDPKPLLDMQFHTGFTAYHSLTADKFNDSDGDITALRQETDNRMTVYGANARVGIDPPWIPASLELFFEGRRERFHPVSLLPKPSEGPDRLRSVRTLSVSSDIQPTGDRFVLTVGGRFEWHENDFYDEPPFPRLPPTPQGKVEDSEGTPHAGFRYHMLDWLCIKGNWGRYYRLPTFLELFGNLGSVTGNPDLEPERGTNRDIGIILKGDRLSFMKHPYLELVYLGNDTENLILFFPNSQYTSAPVNIGSASIRGLESSFACSLPRSIHLSGSYTYLDHRDNGPIPYYNGNRLAAQPVHQALGRIEIVRTRWRIEYELNYIGANYLDRANMIKVPAREIHNLLLEFSLSSRGITLSLEGRNLGNNQISDVNGFPLPGRSFYSTFSITM